jgi:hypothetical protein
MRERRMQYRVNAVDTSGTLVLHRDTAVAAIKKAEELIADGSWDVEIVAPDGVGYGATEFDQLKSQSGALT